ncbi:MAG: serine hydrolase [Lachnospiraceae bacterium]|nr:serine hydrolase [Lachnospiraceae bacterium]
MLKIERALPEQTGIPSDCIIRSLERLEQKQIPMHSFLLMHHDKLICECYYSPCNTDTLHRMFSITKSFTSIAIGLLADEGKLSLEDKIVDYFPEKVPANVHPYIADMTIRDMLMMRTCHEKTTYKLDLETDWVESFFTTPPTHPAGTVFHYDTSSAHTLCALAEKLSGTDMLDYIKKKLAPIGLSEESYLLKDPFGVSIGGSGLVATSMDMLKFGIFLKREGKIDGKQLLSASYIREATSCLTATAVTAPLPSEACGYGMQFWRTQKNGYVCYGMGGQLIIVLPDYDLICVTTADTQGIGGGNQQIYDALYEEILPYTDRGSILNTANQAATVGDSVAITEGQTDYERFITSRTLYTSGGHKTCPLSEEISGKRFRISNSDTFSSMQISFEAETAGHFFFEYKGQEYTIVFGMGKPETGTLPLYAFYYAASGVWLSDNTLYVKVNIIDSCVGSIHLQFSFQENQMVLFMRKQEESLLQEFTGHLVGDIEE